MDGLLQSRKTQATEERSFETDFLMQRAAGTLTLKPVEDAGEARSTHPARTIIHAIR